MRSYRKAIQMLLVFGTAGMALGVGLVVFYAVKKNIFLVKVGLVYVLVSTLLLGIRGVLLHFDAMNKRRRSENSGRLQRT